MNLKEKPWIDLPNSIYIKKILDTYKLYSGKWNHNWNYRYYKELHESAAVCRTKSTELWTDVWEKLWASYRHELHPIQIRAAIIALISYDCSHLLDSDIKDVELLSKLDVPGAFLIYTLLDCRK